MCRNPRVQRAGKAGWSVTILADIFSTSLGTTARSCNQLVRASEHSGLIVHRNIALALPSLQNNLQQRDISNATAVGQAVLGGA
jgi:hypothetical protein